jgi:hypothetical protein
MVLEQALKSYVSFYESKDMNMSNDLQIKTKQVRVDLADVT